MIFLRSQEKGPACNFPKKLIKFGTYFFLLFSLVLIFHLNAIPRTSDRGIRTSFESKPLEWAGDFGQGASITQKDSYQGRSALLLNAENKSREVQVFTRVVPVKPREEYELKVYVKQLGAGNYKATIEWLRDGEHLGYVNDWKGTNNPDRYTTHGGRFQAPDNTDAARLILGVNKGNKVFFDKLRFLSASSSDGSTGELKVPREAIKSICHSKIDVSKGEFDLSEVGKECVTRDWLQQHRSEVKSLQAGEKAGLPELSEGVNLIPKKMDRGFKWPFYVYIPKSYFNDNGNRPGKINNLLIEPVNTGRPSDDYQIHKHAAYKLAYYHPLGEELNTPVLVPTFPRPRSGKRDYHYYTHALDRDTLKIDNEHDELYRIDKQLIAMADYLLLILAESHDIHLEDDFFVFGFSASSNFANRLATLHPYRIAAVAAGGLNGMPIIPKGLAEGEADHKVKLIYPIGIYDISELTGSELNLEEYRNTPQFLFMGSEDYNDTLGYGDCFSDAERNKILEFFDTCILNPPQNPDFTERSGKYHDDVCGRGHSEEMVERFRLAKEMYEEEDLPARFVVYEGAEHTPRPAYSDIISFFRGEYENIVETKFFRRK